jgi:hypothetical protein
MSKSLHEAIQQVQEKVAPNVQKRIGTENPVKYDTERGGRKGVDLPRLKKKVKAGATIKSVSPDMQDSVEHDGDDLNEKEFEVRRTGNLLAKIGNMAKAGKITPDQAKDAERSLARKTAREKSKAPKGSSDAHNVLANYGRRYRPGTKTPAPEPGTQRAADASTAAAIDRDRKRGFTTDSTNFSDRVLQGASDLLEKVDRTQRLVKVALGRAKQLSDPNKKKRAVDKLNRLGFKALDHGTETLHKAQFANIDREDKGRPKKPEVSAGQSDSPSRLVDRMKELETSGGSDAEKAKVMNTAKRVDRQYKGDLGREKRTRARLRAVPGSILGPGPR